MDKLSDIIARPAKGPEAQQNSAKAAARARDVTAFLEALKEKRSAQRTAELTAKISAMLEKSRINRADALQQLQNMPAASDDDVLANLLDIIDNAPATDDNAAPAMDENAAPAVLTSDHAARFAAQLQKDDTADVAEELVNKYADKGELSDEDVEALRQEAMDALKDKGVDRDGVEKFLVKLAIELKDAMTPQQTTQLMMPPRPGTEGILPHGLSAKADSDFVPATSPQDLAAQQLQQQAANGSRLPQQASAQAKAQVAEHAPAPGNAANTQAAGNMFAQQDTGARAATSDVSSSLALVNQLASQDNAGNGGNAGGQQGQFGQQGFTLAATAGTQGTTAMQGSFASHMTQQSSATANTQMIALQIQRNAAAQTDTFKLQLLPLDLGRLEVKLKFGRDGTMKAHLTADKEETLTLLQKDAAQLHRALQDAGIDLDEGSLSFDMRQQGGDADDRKGFGYDAGAQGGIASDDDYTAGNAVQAHLALQAAGAVRQGGINITV